MCKMKLYSVCVSHLLETENTPKHIEKTVIKTMYTPISRPSERICNGTPSTHRRLKPLLHHITRISRFVGWNVTGWLAAAARLSYRIGSLSPPISKSGQKRNGLNPRWMRMMSWWQPTILFDSTLLLHW